MNPESLLERMWEERATAILRTHNHGVARDAMTMHEAGSSLTNIRETIERNYSPHFMTQTPTPPVP